MGPMTSAAEQVHVGGGMPEFESAWKSYGEEAARAGHHERQRSGVPGFVAALGVVSSTLLAWGTDPGPDGFPIALFMVFLGLAGVGLSVFHSVRSYQHRRRAASDWMEVEARLADAGIPPYVHRAADPEPEPGRLVQPVVSGILWSLVPLLVALVGAVYLLRAFTGP